MSTADTTREDPRDAPAERALGVALALAFAGVLLAIWIVDYLPTHDGPQHVFLGHLENHYGDPGSGYDRYLAHGQPFTALGFGVLFSLFEAIAPWRMALRLTLSVIALVWSAGHLGLATAIHPRRAALGLVGLATAISWSLYMGFFSYTLSIGLTFVIIAAAARGWPWTPGRRVVIASLLLVQAVAHAFGAELTGVVLLAMALLAPGLSPRARAREIGLLALMGLPAALIALTAASPETSRTEWLSLAEHLTVLPRTFAPGPVWRAWAPLALALGGIASAATRARRGELLPAERAVLASSALFLALSFTLPIHLASWEFFAPRFLPAGCLLGVTLIPLERLGPARRRAAIAGLGALTAAMLAWSVSTSTSLRARVDEALSGLSAPVRRAGPRLIVAMDPTAGVTPDPGGDLAKQPIPYHAPLFNMGALYAVQQGGIPPYVFTTSPRLHAFVFSPEGRSKYPELYDPTDLRDPRLAADPTFRRGFMTFLAMMGAAFEDVVLDGRPEDGDVLIERGYQVDVRRGGLFMGRFAGCPMEIEVSAPSPRAEAVFFEYGADPLPMAVSRRVLPPSNAPGGETRRLQPDVAPCGPVWLRMTLDRDRSGTISRGDTFCEGADGEGKLRATLSPGAAPARLTCRLAR